MRSGVLQTRASGWASALGGLDALADEAGVNVAALADPAATAASGERARRFVAENRGAADATADLVLPLLFARSGDSAAAK